MDTTDLSKLSDADLLAQYQQLSADQGPQRPAIPETTSRGDPGPQAADAPAPGQPDSSAQDSGSPAPAPASAPVSQSAPTPDSETPGAFDPSRPDASAPQGDAAQATENTGSSSPSAGKFDHLSDAELIAKFHELSASATSGNRVTENPTNPVDAAIPRFNAADIVKGMTPADLNRISADPQFAQQVFDDYAAHVRRFQSGQDIMSLDPKNQADRNYFGYLQAQNLLPNSSVPGLWDIVKDTASSAVHGIEEWSNNISLPWEFKDPAEAMKADHRAEAEGLQGLNLVRSSYQYMSAKAVQLFARHDSRDEQGPGGQMLPYDDPTVQARVRQTELAADLTHYQRIVQIGQKTQASSDQLQKMAQAAGASAQAFQGAGLVASVVEDPVNYVLPAIGKGIGAAMSVGDKPVLGIAEGYRMKVAALSAQQADLTKQLATFTESTGSEYAAERLPLLEAQHAATTGELQTAQTGFDQANADVRSWMSRYGAGLTAATTGGALKVIAWPLEKAGAWLDSVNDATASARASVASSLPKRVGDVLQVKNWVPTGVLGAGVGYLAGGGDSGSGIKGFVAGVVAPELMERAGAIVRSLGETVALGQTSMPFWSRFSEALTANGLPKAGKLAQLADPFATSTTDAGLFGKSFALGKRVGAVGADAVGGAVKGAAVGGALGYATGGDSSSAESGAATAVGIHLGLPFALAGGFADAFHPVYSADELAAMRVGNLRALQTRWKSDTANTERLNSLAPAQQLDIAAFANSSPDFSLLLLTNEGDQARAQAAFATEPEKLPNLNTTPGLRFTDPTSGRSAIAINPNHQGWLAPVIAHEAMHAVIASGGEDAVKRLVLGDPALNLPGTATLVGPDGQPIKNTDGSNVLHPDFLAAKSEYERRMARVTGVPVPLRPEDFALEYAAESGADRILGESAGAPVVDTTSIARPTVGDFVRDLAGGNTFVRNILAKFGVGFRPEGDIVRASMNLPGEGKLGLRHSPQIDQMMRDYTEDWLARRSSPDPEEPTGVATGREAILKNPSLLQTLFPSSSEVNWQPNGLPAGVEMREGRPVVVDEEAMFKSARQIAKDQTGMVEAIQEAVESAKDVAGNPDAVRSVAPEKGEPVLAGRYFSPETIAAIEASGKFNPVQMANLRNLSNWIRDNSGSFTRMLYQPAGVGRRYASLKAGWRSEVPYSLRVTKAENVTVSTLAYDHAVANLAKMWKTHTGEMSRQFTDQVSAVASLKKYLTNLSSGKPGADGLTEQRRDLLNIATGISTKGREKSNPLFGPDAKKLTIFIRQRRIDRINRLSADDRPENFPWSPSAYEKAKVNFTLGPGDGSPDVIFPGHPDYPTPEAEQPTSPEPAAPTAQEVPNPGVVAPRSPSTRVSDAQGARDASDQVTGQPGAVTPLTHAPDTSSTVEDRPPQPMSPGEQADLPNRISTRVPTAKKATEDALASQLAIGTEHVVPDKESATEVAKILRRYPNVAARGKAADVINDFKDHVVNNLLWLHDQTPPELRERARLWYDGAREIAEHYSTKYGITTPQAAGVLASMSPQKDWFQNVDLARRVIETHAHLQDRILPPDAVRWYQQKFGDKAPDVAADLAAASGSNFNALQTSQKAIWVRAHDELNNARNYPLVNPEGTFGDNVTKVDGGSAKVAWGDFTTIGKAVSILEDGSRGNISAKLGQEHKVRNFFNNILLPRNTDGSVTIDTHAVAAGLLRPLAGSDEPVAHNFGSGAPGSAFTGASGLYGLYADAYREAAKQRGILPREMQSITWEAVRGLFSPEFKTAKNKAAVDAVWKEYKDGNLDLDAARKQILTLAGGKIAPPSWAVSNP